MSYASQDLFGAYPTLVDLSDVIPFDDSFYISFIYLISASGRYVSGFGTESHLLSVSSISALPLHIASPADR